MTATTESSTPPVEAPPQGALDRAEGIELLGDLDGAGYKDGAALVRRSDGQMVQLGPLMYALLESVDGKRTNAELASLLCERIGRACDEEHVAALANKLAAQGLLAGSEHQAPPRRNPLLALRWKVLVTNPKVTSRLTAPFTIFFRPWIMWPAVAAFVGVCWFLLIHKGVASATSDAFQNPGLLLLVFLLAVASAGLHELGHAAACRYGGATPGGMGMGLYMVWPAFYTDVTDSYRLPRRDRLRVDLGGIYFNVLISVATLGIWLAWRKDALLLLIALQLLMMVKNLSPVIRSDGYHILADATGVPDLYAHMLPTLRRLIPGHRREPSALTGRARLLVTVWVLVIVPVLLSMLFGAVILLPRLVTTAWESGRTIVSGMPHEGVLAILADCVRLLALSLPVLGSALMTQKLARGLAGKARSWSTGRPVRQTALAFATAGAAALGAWAWWPAGQYQPVRAADRGTLASFGYLVSSPTAVAHPSSRRPAAVRLTPGTHLAVSMIPVGGATKKHPALFVIAGDGDQPAVAIMSDSTPDPADPSSTDTTAATTTTTAASTPAPAAAVQATAFPFKLPADPGPGGTQAVALGKEDGGVTYDVAYSLVTVKDGAPVDNANRAYALASCKACTTVAVSFQVVLIVGQSNTIMPSNAAVALNKDCPACLTTAIADQIVVTLKSQPSHELLAKLQDALQQLDALPALGADGTPAAVAAAVMKVQQQIDDALKESGQLANPATTATGTTTTSTSTTATGPGSTTTTSTATSGTTTSSTTTAKATTTTTTATTTSTPTTTAQTTTTTPATTTTETTTTTG